MMLSAIKEIINPEVVLNIATGDERLTIKESGTDSKIKKLHIENVPKEAFAFTLDHQSDKKKKNWFKQLSWYVDPSNNRGVNKGCDLVLLIPKPDNQWIVLIFELKSEKPRKKATEKQLLNSELYVRYLMMMVKHHYKIDTDSVKYKRAIVSTKVKKTATYLPNEKKSGMDSYHTKAIRVKNKQARVHLDALLK